MKYGEQYENTMINKITGEHTPYTETYKYAEYGDYHTNNQGEGLWRGTKQLLGTCQFTVTGCKTEKAAIAKIRKVSKAWES